MLSRVYEKDTHLEKYCKSSVWQGQKGVPIRPNCLNDREIIFKLASDFLTTKLNPGRKWYMPSKSINLHPGPYGENGGQNKVTATQLSYQKITFHIPFFRQFLKCEF